MTGVLPLPCAIANAGTAGPHPSLLKAGLRPNHRLEKRKRPSESFIGSSDKIATTATTATPATPATPAMARPSPDAINPTDDNPIIRPSNRGSGMTAAMRCRLPPPTRQSQTARKVAQALVTYSASKTGPLSKPAIGGATQNAADTASSNVTTEDEPVNQAVEGVEQPTKPSRPRKRKKGWNQRKGGKMRKAECAQERDQEAPAMYVWLFVGCILAVPCMHTCVHHLTSLPCAAAQRHSPRSKSRMRSE